LTETVVTQQVKSAGFVNSGYNRKNQARIAQEEKELEDLTKQKSEDEDTPPLETKEDKPLSREEESFKKRYGDLRRHTQEKEREWQEKFDSLEARIANPSAVLPTSDEDLEAWISKNPDVAAIVQTMAAKEAEKRLKGTEDKLRQIDEDRHEITRKQAEQTIRDAHSDFDAIKESDDFHDWAEDQPKWVQDAIYENADDPRSVVRVIDLYKVDKGLTKSAKKQQDRDAVSLVKAKTKVALENDSGEVTYSESQINKMSDKDYEKHQDKIMEAMRTGKFRYDLSGAAR